MREPKNGWVDANTLPPRYAALLPKAVRGRGDTNIINLTPTEAANMKSLKDGMAAFRERTIREAAARMKK